jgi:hypothetical protein
MPPTTWKWSGRDDNTEASTSPGPQDQFSRREFDRDLRVANAGRRVGYDRPVTVGTWTWRVASVLVVVAVILALALPAAASARSSLYYATESVFRPTYAQIPLRTGYTIPSQPPPAGFAPFGLANGRFQSPWAVGWSSSSPIPVGGGNCAVNPAHASGYLFLQFSKPTTVDRIVIRAGLDHSDPRWSGLDRPKRVGLSYANHPCAQLRLADQSDPQGFDVHMANVREVTIVVMAVFPPVSTNLGATAITSVAFMNRR